MKESAISQFIKELIGLTGATPEQLAKKTPNSSIWTFRKGGDTRLDTIKHLAGVLYNQRGLVLSIIIEGQKIPFDDFNYKLFHLMHSNGSSVRQMAERIGISHNTLRSRLTRSSCTMAQLNEHLEAVGMNLIFEINNTKYTIK